MPINKELARLVAENLKAAGIKGIIMEGDAAGITAAIRGGLAEQSSNPGNRASVLSEEHKTVDGCRKCRLGSIRTHAVYGDGNEYAEILFIGEAPGAEEDKQGLPFVGRAGKLLDRLLEQVGLRRSEVYICNIIKCRPPENREPLPDEIEACHPYLNKQITVIKPKAIICLGLYAAQTVLNSKESLSRLRAGQHKVGGIAVFPTYHTAAALRFPAYKQQIYDDIHRARDYAYG